MNNFDVYPRYDITPVKGQGCRVWDEQGNEYLDVYGGHAVISIGHSHPRYVQRIKDQVEQLGFYSNSINIPLQEALAEKLGKISGYEDYALFLCSSGAEANENALKLASFHNGKKKILAFEGGFHGRTHGAVAATDNPKIQAPINTADHVTICEMENAEQVENHLKTGEYCAIIIEGIQGVNGILTPSVEFLRALSTLCAKYDTLLILDEVQSGYGRTGKFFAHQHADIKPDIITMAKGMGNGFPIGGILIHPKFVATPGLLGTTFGGNHLACAAGLAVLEILEEEQLLENARKIGGYLQEAFRAMPQIIEVRGKGLMIGLKFDMPIAELRKALLFDQYVFTGNSSQKDILRLLPPLCFTKEDADELIEKLRKLL